VAGWRPFIDEEAYMLCKQYANKGKLLQTCVWSSLDSACGDGGPGGTHLLDGGGGFKTRSCVSYGTSYSARDNDIKRANSL